MLARAYHKLNISARLINPGSSSSFPLLISNVHNTWQRKKHAHTYRFPKKDGLQQAQIDFVMIRACQADAAARCARPLRTPFVPATGMHHLPILVSLPRPTRPRTPTTCRSVTAADVNIMLRDHPHLSLQFQDCVQQLLTPHTVPAGTPSIEPVRDPNSVLLSAWTSVTKGLPTPPKPTGVATHSPGMVRQLWKLRHLRSHLPATCSIMRRWLITAKLAKLQRQLHRICRDKKRERIDGILQEAAASPHLSAIYSAIRRLAPKSRHQCIQLRDKQGNLLSPQQETEAIAEYFRGVYGSTGQLSPPLSRPLFGVQFELDDLQRGLRNLCRLVFAPARLWKDTAALIAPLLLPAMNLQQQALYPRWHEVQVCTLPKVHTVKLPKLDSVQQGHGLTF